MKFPLILPDVVAVFAGVTAIFHLISYLKTKNPLDFGLIIPRFYVCGVYSWFALYHDLPIETTRLWARDGWALLLGTEMIYQFILLIRPWLERKAANHANKLIGK